MAAEEDEDDGEARNAALFGDGPYEAAGRPMFTRLYTYDELLTVERPAGRYRKRQPLANADFKRPDNWPEDTQPFKGTWVFWLPEGWAQGIRTQASSGKTLMCYFTPEGKRFWHKHTIEKYLGRELPKQEPPPVKVSESGEEVKVIRRVTDPDAIPVWPEVMLGDEDFKLPLDWKIGWRQLPQGLHRIYVPPGKDDEGFLYHQADAKEWLAGTKTKLCPFEGSKFMAEVRGMEGGSLQSLVQPKKKGRPADVTVDDFEECEELKIAALDEAVGLAGEAQKKVHEMLRLRGFKHPDLVHVAFQRDRQKHHEVTENMSGLFFKTKGGWEGAPAYQHIQPCPTAYGGVACSSVYLSMTDACGSPNRLRIGDLSEGLNGTLAICSGKDMSGKWLVRKAPRIS